MQVTVNGAVRECDHSLTVSEFLQRLGYDAGFIAVAVDGSHVPRQEWSKTFIHAGQSIEIVSPMQGG
jgi:sulfur carrier protein